MAARFWQELGHPDFAALDRERTVAVLPVAAVEQHGPHLPVGVDAIINQGILARAMALAESGPPVLVLPPLNIGLSPEHRDFPGTLTLTAATMLQLVSEVAAGVVRVGLRKLLFFNSHGGQPQLLELVAQELRTDHAMTAMVVNSWRLMRSADLFPASEIREGIHAGAIETAILRHLAPGLVREAAIARFGSSARGLGEEFPRLAPDGRLAFAWQTQDLNPAGAVGDATLATPEQGRILVEQAASALVGLWEELSRLPAIRAG